MDIRKVLFEEGSYADKVSVIKGVEQRELVSFFGCTLLVKDIINKVGKDNQIRIVRDFRVGNNWNSDFEKVYVSNGTLYVSLYVQDDSTDTSMSVTFSSFFRCDDGSYYCERLSKSVRYDIFEKAECMRSLFLSCVYYLWSDENKKNEIVAKLSHYSIINPVSNYFFNRYKFSFDSSSCDSVTNRKAYDHGKKALNEYIRNNYAELQGKKEDELVSIYKKVFDEARKAFIESFDYWEWRKDKILI